MRSETGIELLKKAAQADTDGDHGKARELRSEANVYLTPLDKVEMGAGNEVLPQQTSGIEGYKARQIKDTLKKPCQVSIDASHMRMELMQQVGVLELGLDAAESIGAENSFERMLAHQAVTCHKTALQLFAQSEEYRATGEKPEKRERLHIEAQTRYINTACRLMDTFQRTMTTIQKLRTGGQQVVTVQHVQVNNAGDNSQTLITGERGQTMGTVNKKQDQPQGQRNGSLKNGNPPCDLALLPRCNAMAKTTGVRCKQAAMKNGKCYWHGGASKGAPLGNMNSFKHGMYTKKSLERRKNIRQLLKACRDALNRLQP